MQTLLLAAASAFIAQVSPPPPADDPNNPCVGFTNGGGTGAGGDGAAAPDVPIDPGGGSLSVASPAANTSNVPRNVEIRLVGDVTTLDADPPTFAVELVASDDSRVPMSRDGLQLRPTTPLDAHAGYIIHIEPTDANQCPECFGIQEVAFATSDEIDTTNPVLTGTPAVNVFVLPSPELAAQCGMFFNQTHQVIIDFGPAFPTNTFINVVGKPARGDIKNLIEFFNTGAPFPFSSDLGATLPVALGDEFLIAFTPRDLAGNSGGARIIRTRARSFIDENKPRDELDPLWCEMPAVPQLTAAASVPSNGRIQIEFPFEETPVAIRDRNGEQTPLIPVEDIDGGHVYNTAIPLAAGDYDVIALACPHCLCDGCAVPAGDTIGAKVSISDVVDTAAPGKPKIKGFKEDSDPALSVAETCHPDRPALIALIEPGTDDHTSALDLRYDAVISVDGGPTLALARSLVPAERADGSLAVRIDTRGLGRVLGRPFDLTLTAVDAAGNKTDATAHNDPKPEDKGGCASTGATSLAGLALLALTLRRRRR